MASRQFKIIIGVSMVGIGLLQASLFMMQSERIPVGLGIFYSVLGIVYLWAEVYSTR